MSTDIDGDAMLRRAARSLLNARVAMATGTHKPVEEARAWDRLALALDIAEDAAREVSA